MCNRNGTNCYLPTALHARPGEIEISFSAPLDASVATEISRYKIKQWNYQWTKTYGSKDYSVAEPEKQGRDDVDVTSVQISPDRKTVVLEIPGLQTVMQMVIDYDILAADGEKMLGPIFNTINRLEPATHGGE